jgi:hypothetical protein
MSPSPMKPIRGSDVTGASMCRRGFRAATVRERESCATYKSANHASRIQHLPVSKISSCRGARDQLGRSCRKRFARGVPVSTRSYKRTLYRGHVIGQALWGVRPVWCHRLDNAGRGRIGSIARQMSAGTTYILHPRCIAWRVSINGVRCQLEQCRTSAWGWDLHTGLTDLALAGLPRRLTCAAGGRERTSGR